MTHQRHDAHGTILCGGISLIAGAIAFMGVFTYLAAQFNYPAVLDGKAGDVLPALLGTGSNGRAAWALYSLLPLTFIPAGVAAFEALKGKSEAMMRVASQFALLAALTMVLGLMRWPSIHWELARAWRAANPEQQQTLATVFDGLNTYVGNYIGEFLGELSFSVFFLVSGIALLRHARAPRWVAWWGVVTGALGLIGLWRNVTSIVNLVAEANNYLLPAWMVGFGVWLILESRIPAGAEDPCNRPVARE
jgi:hypothetical protein